MIAQDYLYGQNWADQVIVAMHHCVERIVPVCKQHSISQGFIWVYTEQGQDIWGTRDWCMRKDLDDDDVLGPHYVLRR